MPFTMPTPPPDLLQLLRRGGVPPSGGPAVQADPQSMSVTPTGPDVLRSAITPQAPQQTSPTQAAPPPSDDPAISPTPKAPDVSNSPVTGLLKSMQDTQARISAVPKPDPTQLKPKWYDRLLGAGVGFAAGWGNAERGYDLGSNVTNRRWNSAQTQYERTVTPLQAQLQSEREQLPAAEAAAKIPQTDWENRMQQHREERETFTAKSTAQYKSDLNDIRTMMDQGKLDMAQQRINETAEKNKNDYELKNKLLELRQQIFDMKQSQNQQGKPQQFASVANRKAQALQKAEANYRKTLSQLTPDDKKAQEEALQQLYEDKQAAQDAYEEGVTTLGGTAEHLDVTQPGPSKPAPTPASAPQQTTNAGVSADLWKGREGKRLVMSDGSKWELQNGRPVQVSAPTKK